MALGPGDDCALLDIPMNMQLAVSSDTLVADYHFPNAINPYDLGFRCLAANLSDLAAMGATPAWFSLCLTLPQAGPQFLQGFAAGLSTLAQTEGISLLGGDITRGPLSISIQVMGLIPRGEALTRSGAQVGDLVVVSGSLGDAATGLQLLQQGYPQNNEQSWLVQRFCHPSARLRLGQNLRGLAHAAIDISDGLLQDLSHILKASQLGADLELKQLPLSNALQSELDLEQAQQKALFGGEDFELCFTLATNKQPVLAQLSKNLNLALTVIGSIRAQPGYSCFDSDGYEIKLTGQGYQHFYEHTTDDEPYS